MLASTTAPHHGGTLAFIPPVDIVALVAPVDSSIGSIYVAAILTNVLTIYEQINSLKLYILKKSILILILKIKEIFD